MHTFEKEYREFVVPYAPPKGDIHRIMVPEQKIKKVKDFSFEVARAKMSEQHHIVDSNSEFKRQYTGILGEAAMEEFFGVDIIDYNIGNSSIYNVADMKKAGFDVGIKTVEVWKFPIVHKNPYRPELICVKRTDNEVLLFGLASISTLLNYQTDRFILDEKLKQRGTKSAFYGFSKLKKINSLEDLSIERYR